MSLDCYGISDLFNQNCSIPLLLPQSTKHLPSGSREIQLPVSPVIVACVQFPLPEVSVSIVAVTLFLIPHASMHHCACGEFDDLPPNKTDNVINRWVKPWWL